MNIGGLLTNVFGNTAQAALQQARPQPQPQPEDIYDYMARRGFGGGVGGAVGQMAPPMIHTMADYGQPQMADFGQQQYAPGAVLGSQAQPFGSGVGGAVGATQGPRWVPRPFPMAYVGVGRR